MLVSVAHIDAVCFGYLVVSCNMVYCAFGLGCLCCCLCLHLILLLCLVAGCFCCMFGGLFGC